MDPARVYVATWSLNRKLTALRVVEAIRDYLVTHEGHFPANLSNIQAVPVPLDPLTGQPFVWSVKDGIGTLRGPELVDAADLGEPVQAAFLEYRLRVK